MIVVTGATGELGRSIVEQLVRRLPAEQVGASARDPSKAADLSRLGVRVRQGDFAQPESLAHAFEGAKQVLLVSSNAAAYGGNPLLQHRDAIAAARAAGVQRVLYTSHMAASPISAFAPARDHAATEQMLQDSGLEWTALRNGFYATSGIAMMGDALTSGELTAPADGKVSWTAHADLAEAAAVILADEGCFDGPTPPLTGAEALDFADLARVASELLARPLSRRLVSDDQLRAKLAASGAPPGRVEIALGFFLAGRNGELARVDPTLENLLGRRPLTFRDVLARQLAPS